MSYALSQGVPLKNIDSEALLPILRQVTIFAGISDNGLRLIIDECAFEQHKAGALIIEQGTPASEIYIVLSGQVRVFIERDEGVLELCRFGPGSCIGEASVIGVLDHSANVELIQEGMLLVLSRQLLMNIYESDKNFFAILILNIARELARRLHTTDEILYHYSRKPSGESELPHSPINH
jgi:CRP-like cAMP-binding protein